AAIPRRSPRRRISYPIEMIQQSADAVVLTRRRADETAESKDLDGEEVGRGGHAEVRLEEGLPQHRPAALGRGLQAMLGQDALDRVAAELARLEVCREACTPETTD